MHLVFRQLYRLFLVTLTLLALVAPQMSFAGERRYTYYIFKNSIENAAGHPGTRVDTALFVQNPADNQEMQQTCGEYIVHNGQSMAGYPEVDCRSCHASLAEGMLALFKGDFHQAVQQRGVANLRAGANNVAQRDGQIVCQDDGYGVFQVSWECACK